MAAAEAQSREEICPDGYAALSANDAEAAIEAFEACLADQFYDWPEEAELRARLGADPSTSWAAYVVGVLSVLLHVQGPRQPWAQRLYRLLLRTSNA